MEYLLSPRPQAVGYGESSDLLVEIWRQNTTFRVHWKALPGSPRKLFAATPSQRGRGMLIDKSAKSAGSGAPGGQGSSQIPAGSAGGDTAVPGPQPNILFILVDELRFPKWVFPAGVTDADGLFQKTHAELLQADLDKGREVLQLLHRRQCLHAGPRHHHLRPLLAAKLADDDDHSTPRSEPHPIETAGAQPRVSDLRQAASESRLPDAVPGKAARLHPPGPARVGWIATASTTAPPRQAHIPIRRAPISREHTETSAGVISMTPIQRRPRPKSWRASGQTARPGVSP